MESVVKPGPVLGRIKIEIIFRGTIQPSIICGWQCGKLVLTSITFSRDQLDDPLFCQESHQNKVANYSIWEASTYLLAVTVCIGPTKTTKYMLNLITIFHID